MAGCERRAWRCQGVEVQSGEQRSWIHPPPPPRTPPSSSLEESAREASLLVSAAGALGACEVHHQESEEGRSTIKVVRVGFWLAITWSM